MKIKLMFVAAALAFGALAESRFKTPRAAGAATVHDRLQALVDEHMSSEAALATAERAAVTAVRADQWQDEEQIRTAVGRIRRDYRGRTETMTALHLSEKEALDAELL